MQIVQTIFCKQLRKKFRLDNYTFALVFKISADLFGSLALTFSAQPTFSMLKNSGSDVEERKQYQFILLCIARGENKFFGRGRCKLKCTRLDWNYIFFKYELCPILIWTKHQGKLSYLLPQKLELSLTFQF